MDTERLEQTIREILSPGRGILAADESIGTAGKRLSKVKQDNTESNRLAYRRMLLDTEGLQKNISAVILFDETTRQTSEEGTLFVETLAKRGIVPGIKVDMGLSEHPNFPGESLARGLDDLPERLQRYSDESEGRLRFTKWRQTVSIGEGRPSFRIIDQGMARLAEYAAISQAYHYVPIVEPEILMDGNHDGQTCEKVTREALIRLFEHLVQAKVVLKYTILKPNMVVPGTLYSKGRWPSQTVGEKTHRVLDDVLPREVPGVAFLSGGMTPRESTANLNATVQALHKGGKRRTYTFSFGRALQDRALRTWAGKMTNLDSARKKLLEDAGQNGLAQLGKYDEAKDPRER
jgi:fructose-bisphosphate aldolase, class I